MTYIWVGVLTACQVTAWLGWFIVEIIIHSLNSDYSTGSYLQLEITQSMQIYQYEGVILAGTITALHLAASVKTRAARVASFVVQMFAFLAWFWELYFIIPTFRSTSDPTNLFCASFTASPLPGTPTFTAPNSTCRLARAVAAFAVIMQFFQSIIVLYSFVNMFVPPRLQDGTRKEIIEEDDAEVATVVSANPAGYQQINARVGMWSYASLSMVLLSITGYAIMMYAMIDVVRVTGFQVLGTYNNVLGSNNASQLGDALLSVNFRQLSIVLVFSLCTSAYAAFRHNRGIQAGALFLTAITMLQWWSWIIEGGRYLWQYHPDANPDSLATGNSYPSLSAQDAMYAGACCIVAGETIRSVFLLLRYYSYVPVTRNNVIPTYIRGAFATANPIPVVLFWLEVTVTVAWFVLQFVHESDSGIFSYQDAPFNIPLANMVTDTLFIWQTLFFVAVWIPELFSERTKTLASKQASLAVNITVMSAWWLLMWPWAYAAIYRSGSWESGFTAPGSPAPFPGFCVEQFWGNDNCQLAQGAAILAIISGSGYLFLSFYQLGRILTMLPTPGQVATIDGTVVDALPPTVGIQKALGWNSGLVLIGLLIWALAGISSGSSEPGFISWTFGQLIGTPGAGAALPSILYAYTYSVAFGMLIIIGFTVWSASELAANPVVANWHAWRTLVTGLSALLFTFFIPFFIMICRYINWDIGISSSGALNPTELAIAAGIIIMCIGEYALYASALITQRSPLIALPAAINNIIQPTKANADLTGVMVQQPGGAERVPGTTTTTTTASTEPTVVTQTTTQAVPEYSQQPAAPAVQ